MGGKGRKAESGSVGDGDAMRGGGEMKRGGTNVNDVGHS